MYLVKESSRFNRLIKFRLFCRFWKVLLFGLEANYQLTNMCFIPFLVIFDDFSMWSVPKGGTPSKKKFEISTLIAKEVLKLMKTVG